MKERRIGKTTVKGPPDPRADILQVVYFRWGAAIYDAANGPVKPEHIPYAAINSAGMVKTIYSNCPPHMTAPVKEKLESFKRGTQYTVPSGETFTWGTPSPD